MVTCFKRPHARTDALSASDPGAGPRRPSPPPDSWTLMGCLGQFLVESLLLFLGPGAHKIFGGPSKRLFSQSCVNSGDSMAG